MSLAAKAFTLHEGVELIVPDIRARVALEYELRSVEIILGSCCLVQWRVSVVTGIYTFTVVDEQFGDVGPSPSSV